MRMKKHLIAALLLCGMLLSLCLASCNNNSEESSAAPSENSQTASAEESKEDRALVPHLGKRDLGGFTLTFLACEPDGDFNTEQFAPEELNEEPFNDAVYNRNKRLTDEYNCYVDVVWTEGFGSYETKVENDILAGNADYNVLMTGIQTLGAIAEKRYLYDLNNIEGSNLHLNDEWWDKSADEAMTIEGMLFFATGDITVYDDQCTQCIFFNKDMIEAKGLDNPYQLVYDGDWTLDAMWEMSRAVAVAGGDGTMNMELDDTYGFVGAAFDTYKLIMGMDCPQIEKDSNGAPVVAIGNERTVNAFKKAYNFMSDRACNVYLEQYYRWNDYDNNYRVKEHFYIGQALFLADNVWAASYEKMRATTFNYGVLPTPKFDSEQERYVSAVDPYRFYAMAIPKVNDMDIDKVTFVLDAIAYLNKESVTPIYYEVTLKEKRFRDDDAPKMLDTIFANRCVDPSVIFNWDNCIQYYNSMLFGGQSVPAFMEANGEKLEDAMNQCIEELRASSNS